MKRLLLAAVVLGLGGCALQPQAPIEQRPAQQPAHPRYAPPPGVQSYWSPPLGVYVVKGVQDLYYRERVFYRWQNGGWNWSPQAGGPWRATDSSGIPPGLYRQYQNR